jgi:hypothetical protein
MSARKIEIRLEKRRVRCTAQLLEDLAPKTCEVLWGALPQGGDAFHAKYASNEVYTLVPPFAAAEPGLENPTMTPIAGDLLYFFFPPGMVALPDIKDTAYKSGIVDLAIFYGRDNFLFSPTMGPTPGTRFGTITENLEEMMEACANVWREGFAGERLLFERAD